MRKFVGPFISEHLPLTHLWRTAIHKCGLVDYLIDFFCYFLMRIASIRFFPLSITSPQSQFMARRHPRLSSFSSVGPMAWNVLSDNLCDPLCSSSA